MLRPPHDRYQKLYVYNLDSVELPQLSDPDLIGAWLEEGNPILFFHRPKDKLIKELCREYGCRIKYQADLDYTDWEAGQEITPFNVEDISVAPLWASTEADIRLDPSVIFGSGFHPSTRLCMETLVKYCRIPEVKLTSMLDLGTGTGLLAITAAHLGLRTIRGVDNNPLACEVAAKNARLNGYNQKIDIIRTDLLKETLDTEVDLIIANLYPTLLADLFATPSFWQAGLYIIAGFIPAMEERLLAALPPHRVRMVERRRIDKWCLWVMAPVHR